jgi:hypothetical protein
MKKTFTIISTVLLGLFSFGATAAAATAVTSDDASLLELAKPVMDAVMKGNWWLAAALSVILLTSATRKYLPDSWGGKYVRSDVGGMLTEFMLSFAGAIATAAAAAGTLFVMEGALALTALKIGFAAVGGFVAIHKLATWMISTSFWNEKMPASVKMAVSFLLGVIGSSAIARAAKAGEAALEAKPSTGANELAGEPTKL